MTSLFASRPLERYFIVVILLKDLTKRGNQTSLACFPNLSGNIEQGSLIENTHHLNTFRMTILKKTCQRREGRFPSYSLRLEGLRLDILWENQDLIKTLPRFYLLKQKNVIQSRLWTQNEFLQKSDYTKTHNRKMRRNETRSMIGMELISWIS